MSLLLDGRESHPTVLTASPLFPGFVVHDQKVFSAVLAGRGGKQYRASWPPKQSLLLTVGTAELESLETGFNVGQGAAPCAAAYAVRFRKEPSPKRRGGKMLEETP